MGVVTVSSSASQTPLGLSSRFSNKRSAFRRPFVLGFKTDKTEKISLVSSHEPSPLTTKSHGEKKRLRKATKTSKRVKAVSVEEACAVELDYSEAAAKLENIYKLSPAKEISDVDDTAPVVRRRRRTKKVEKDDEQAKEEKSEYVVRNNKKKVRRLGLDKRIALGRMEKVVEATKGKVNHKTGDGDVDRLVREYSASTDLVSVDWKKMKIPPVLPSSEHIWLFKLMQPHKALLQVREDLYKDLGREPSDAELASATNMSVPRVRRQMEVGRAARSKLIKHNLRLVLFVLNKYFHEIANGPNFQDLCQAGVKGLITSIDRFEPKRSLRLSTYGLFWIRHAIMRSMTTSSFTRVSYGLESVRAEIQREKLRLKFELGREPTEEEILGKIGISHERYREVTRASKAVLSLHARHAVTQEEFINGITDVDGVGGDKRRQPAILRLALDDVLDSLKPKESLVIRQRYGLDGKGDRTLGEIAGNLNISREMVRKHEVKALMKLKHPTRVDYLRRYIY
ncbi:hypothetical protein ACHQM5_011805 [Ranunculus cassubicifolius]